MQLTVISFTGATLRRRAQ